MGRRVQTILPTLQLQEGEYRDVNQNRESVEAEALEVLQSLDDVQSVDSDLDGSTDFVLPFWVSFLSGCQSFLDRGSPRSVSGNLNPVPTVSGVTS